MKRVWITKRPTGYYVTWYANSRQKSKCLPTKRLANQYMARKYHELNTDVFTEAIPVPWNELKKDYYESITHLAENTQKDHKRVIDQLGEVCYLKNSTDLNQKLLDQYLSLRKKENLSPYTYNKILAKIRQFLQWCQDRQYHRNNLTLSRQRQQPPKVTTLTDPQITALIQALPGPEWPIRVVMALATGLRKKTLYRLPRKSVSIEEAGIRQIEKKTGKVTLNPLPDKLTPYLEKHLKTLPEDHPYFFKTINQQWLDTQFRRDRPEEWITMQSLRQTYSTRVESIGISTALLNHSSSSVTRTFYSDMDYLKYIRVNQLPVDKWLEKTS